MAQKITFKEFALREIKKKSLRQIDFLTENDNFIIDKIYKFENIGKELEKLFNILNISSKKSSIKHLNRSPRIKHFYEYYDTGELREFGQFVNGSREGNWKVFYKTGKIKQKGKYSKGEKVGIWKTYYKNEY